METGGSGPARAGRRLWRDFPLLYVAAGAVGIAYVEIAHLEPPRLDHVVTALFPLAVPVGVYALRWRAADAIDRRLAVAVVGAAFALVAAALLWAPRAPMSTDELRRFYEFSAIAGTACCLLHAWSVDRARLGWLLGPIALYGVLLENGGILLGYFDEPDYALYLGPLPAPVATMAGWILVFYLVCWTTWEVRARVPAVARSAVGSALVATATGLALDLQIDPLATVVGLWRWHGDLPGAVFGAPLVNFVAWACAIWPFAHVVARRQTALGLTSAELMRRPHRRWLLGRVPAVLVIAAAMFLVVSAVAEVGLAGPTFKVLRAGAARLGLPSAPSP